MAWAPQIEGQDLMSIRQQPIETIESEVTMERRRRMKSYFLSDVKGKGKR